MCLAVPAKIVSMEGQMATVEIGGLTKQASLALLPDAGVGDYILIHAGFAISVVDAQEARETIALFRQMLGGAPGAPEESSGGPEAPPA
ncbi:MAG: HypC/HybG/HupF family hydrogenase formation chaperone [Pseudomonadota bacterium]